MSGALTVASLASVLTCLAIQAGWAVYLRQAPYVAAAHDPGVYELAYLAGGTPRVRTTALALLSHDGTVAITPGGRVSLLRHGRMADPAEAAAVRPLRLRARTAPVLSPPTGSLQTANVPTANVPALALLLAGRGLTVRPPVRHRHPGRAGRPQRPGRPAAAGCAVRGRERGGGGSGPWLAVAARTGPREFPPRRAGAAQPVAGVAGR